MTRYTLLICALVLGFMAGAMWAVDDRPLPPIQDYQAVHQVP